MPCETPWLACERAWYESTGNRQRHLLPSLCQQSMRQGIISWEQATHCNVHKSVFELRLGHKPQDLDMGRLQKQIKPSQAFQHVRYPAFSIRHLFCRPRRDAPNLPCLRVHVAPHAHDTLWSKFKRLSNECLVTRISRRIDDELSASRWEVVKGAEDLRRISPAAGDPV